LFARQFAPSVRPDGKRLLAFADWRGARDAVNHVTRNMYEMANARGYGCLDQTPRHLDVGREELSPAPARHTAVMLAGIGVNDDGCAVAASPANRRVEEAADECL